MSTKQFAVKDRDGNVRQEDSRKAALRAKTDFGGQVVISKDGKPYKTYKRKKVFLWVFLAIQVIFIILLVVQLSGNTNGADVHAEVARQCAHGGWAPLFNSHADCVKHYRVALADAGNAGKGLGAGLLAAIWVAVDIILAVIYGIYRLARRS